MVSAEVKKARMILKTIIETQMPVSPSQARQLYLDAEYPIPVSLKETEYSEAEKALYAEIGMKLFQG